MKIVLLRRQVGGKVDQASGGRQGLASLATGRQASPTVKMHKKSKF